MHALSACSGSSACSGTRRGVPHELAAVRTVITPPLPRTTQFFALGLRDQCPSCCPTWFCISFFLFYPVHPTLLQAIFFPQILSFWTSTTLSSREKANSRGWLLGTVLDGVAPQKKRKIPFSGAPKKKVSCALAEGLSYVNHMRELVSLVEIIFGRRVQACLPGIGPHRPCICCATI